VISGVEFLTALAYSEVLSGLPHVSMPVFYSAASTLKKGTTCSSETSVDIQ
jgi:hypothetical protein